MKVEFTVWKVEDSHGNTDGGVVSEGYDIVQVNGMKDHHESRIYFESDFRHLSTWCLENDIKYTTIFETVII